MAAFLVLLAPRPPPPKGPWTSPTNMYPPCRRLSRLTTPQASLQTTHAASASSLKRRQRGTQVGTGWGWGGLLGSCRWPEPDRNWEAVVAAEGDENKGTEGRRTWGLAQPVLGSFRFGARPFMQPTSLFMFRQAAPITAVPCLPPMQCATAWRATLMLSYTRTSTSASSPAHTRPTCSAGSQSTSPSKSRLWCRKVSGVGRRGRGKETGKGARTDRRPLHQMGVDSCLPGAWQRTVWGGQAWQDLLLNSRAQAQARAPAPNCLNFQTPPPN